jgi:GT2 family glycosyltransferase
MAISVIVSNFNGARYLPRLLETLRAQEGVTLEIIVVDRLSSDESKAILAKHPDVRVLDEPPESGLVAGYASAVPHARYENLFFCNEDMWFEPDCLTLAERQLDRSAGVFAVMPLQLTYDGSAVVNAGTWFTGALWHHPNPWPFRASVHCRPTVAEPISGINAGACLIAREAYDEVGGWDPTFFLDYEDLELSIRLWQRGWSCRVEPRAIVYHAVGASNAKTIQNGRSTVARKRYVAALSNEAVIALKSFTGFAWLCAPALFLDRALRDLGRWRLESLGLDVRAAWLTLKRVPTILEYRRANRELNAQRPGQRFFSDARFDILSRRPAEGE